MTMPAGGQFRVRPPVGVSLRGDIAEVWANDERAGLLYQWTVHGSGAKWEGDALKYRIERQFGGEIELRLFIRNVSGAADWNCGPTGTSWATWKRTERCTSHRSGSRARGWKSRREVRMAETKRVKLANKEWAVVRVTGKLSDEVEIRNEAARRGFEDAFLDAVVRLRCRIVEWSKGPVTDEAVGDLDTPDASELFRVINGADRPNPSAPLPDGTSSEGNENEQENQ